MNVYIIIIYYVCKTSFLKAFFFLLYPAAQVPLYEHQNGNGFITIRI